MINKKKAEAVLLAAVASPRGRTVAAHVDDVASTAAERAELSRVAGLVRELSHQSGQGSARRAVAAWLEQLDGEATR